MPTVSAEALQLGWGQINVDHLGGGVNTGIGSAGDSHVERGLGLTKNRGQCLEQFTLNSAVLFLRGKAPKLVPS